MLIKKVVNLTGHRVDIMQDNGQIVSIPSHGKVKMRRWVSEVPNTLGVRIEHFNEWGGKGDEFSMPPKGEGTVYIVSMPVFKAEPKRKDILTPGDLIKNEEGVVIYAQAFRSHSLQYIPEDRVAAYYEAVEESKLRRKEELQKLLDQEDEGEENEAYEGY
jgi:hypothetical protein